MNEDDGPGIEFIPIIVEPKYQGNVGSIARLSKNFGAGEIILVNPPEMGDEMIAYSMHGRDLIESAKVLSSFQEAAGQVDFVVGTSGISDSAEKNYHRNPMFPEEFIRWTRGVRGRVGLAFGREDFGLNKEELDLCDLLVTIPAHPDYPILNLSHAVGILLYEIFKEHGRTVRRNARSITSVEKNTLLDHYDRLMEAGRVPMHKRQIARTNFRRMVSRSNMNYREFNSLMGTFSRAMNYKRRKFRDPE